MTALITLVLMADCVWTVSMVIPVIALRVTLENAVWQVGKSVDLCLVDSCWCSSLKKKIFFEQS